MKKSTFSFFEKIKSPHLVVVVGGGGGGGGTPVHPPPCICIYPCHDLQQRRKSGRKESYYPSMLKNLSSNLGLSSK